MLSPSKPVRRFMENFKVGGQIGYGFPENLYWAANKTSQEDVLETLAFLKAAVASEASDDDLRRFWFSTETYAPKATAQARPFTLSIIEYLAAPQPVGEPPHMQE